MQIHGDVYLCVCVCVYVSGGARGVCLSEKLLFISLDQRMLNNYRRPLASYVKNNRPL